MRFNDIEQGVTEQVNFPRLLTWAVTTAAHSMRENKQKLFILPTTTAYRQTANDHYHHCPEVFLQLAGKAIIDHPTGSITLHKGDVAVIPRGVSHNEYAFDIDKKCYNLVFTYSSWGFRVHSARTEKPRILCRAAISMPDAERCASWLNEAAGYANASHANASAGQNQERNKSAQATNKVNQDIVCRSLLAAHLSRLGQALEHEAQEQQQLPPKVAYALELVNRHIGDPLLSVDWLATEMQCSADYLGTLFSQHIGLPLTKYIATERITRGAQMLVRSHESVAAIARVCGYNDPGYFRRQFQQIRGISPRAYRQMHVTELQ